MQSASPPAIVLARLEREVSATGLMQRRDVGLHYSQWAERSYGHDLRCAQENVLLQVNLSKLQQRQHGVPTPALTTDPSQYHHEALVKGAQSLDAAIVRDTGVHLLQRLRTCNHDPTTKDRSFLRTRAQYLHTPAICASLYRPLAVLTNHIGRTNMKFPYLYFGLLYAETQTYPGEMRLVAT